MSKDFVGTGEGIKDGPIALVRAPWPANWVERLPPAYAVPGWLCCTQPNIFTLFLLCDGHLAAIRPKTNRTDSTK